MRRGFEDVLRIEAAEGAGLENLIYGCSGIIIHSAACPTGSGLLSAR